MCVPCIFPANGFLTKLAKSHKTFSHTFLGNLLNLFFKQFLAIPHPAALQPPGTEFIQLPPTSGAPSYLHPPGTYAPPAASQAQVIYNAEEREETPHDNTRRYVCTGKVENVDFGHSTTV